MFNPNSHDDAGAEERFLSWRRIRIFIVGSVAMVVIGILAVSLYTYTQYGGTPFDKFIGREKKVNPAVGKRAFDKYLNTYIGVIRGEGKNVRRGEVYYIEQAGGQMIEVVKERVETRER
ncbi:MAG TPA: hypothetical protein VNH22_02580 [Blastocatellia bacterium]|jgi:hypothetical protein|nr:hypothetical protein [Blastocatellia bacterium]